MLVVKNMIWYVFLFEFVIMLLLMMKIIELCMYVTLNELKKFSM